MSKHSPLGIRRLAAFALLLAQVACSASDATPSSPNASGGTANAGATSSAGSSATGGANGGSSAGGAQASGGTAPGTAGGGGVLGGASGTAGAGASGAAGAGGAAGAVGCPGASATEFSLVSSWLQNTAATGALPAYAYSNIKTNFPAGAAFDKLACTIAMSCVEWAPMESNWPRKCEAVLTSAIVAESSYNPKSVVNDAYSTRTVGNVTANDPTIGLLQIRFSSTVRDYNYHGSLPKMAAIGCEWPALLSTQADTDTWWATNGGTTYLSFMQDVSCNVGLASWYYFYNATGNGGPSAVYIADYCGGHGVAGTMVTGLLSHLLGGNYARTETGANAYPFGIECCAGGNPSNSTCTGCTGRFAAFMGIGTSSTRPAPDPFEEQLLPEVTKYCK